MSAQRTSLTRFLEKKKNYLSKRLTYKCILYSFQPITMQDFLHCKLSIVIFNQTVKLEEMEKKAGNAEGEVSALRSRLILLQVNFQSLSLNGKFSLYLISSMLGCCKVTLFRRRTTRSKKIASQKPLLNLLVLVLELMERLVFILEL